MDSDERGMNPVAMTIISPRKEYWPTWGSNQQPPVLNPVCYQLSYGARLKHLCHTIPKEDDL